LFQSTPSGWQPAKFCLDATAANAAAAVGGLSQTSKHNIMTEDNGYAFILLKDLI